MTLKQIDFEVPSFGELPGQPALLPSYRAALLARSPTACWSLDETSGTTLSDLANNNTLALSGSYALNQPEAHAAMPGGSIQFTGGVAASTQAVLPISAGDSWSVVFWARRTGILELGSILGQSQAGTPGSMVIKTVKNAKLKVTIDPSQSLSSTLNLNAPWSHLVLTRSASGLVSWFVDGAFDISAALGTGAMADVPFALGNVAAPGLSVELDEVAVFPTALDASTVRWLYRLATGRPTSSTAS